MYYNAGGTCNLSTGGNAYNLTKTGNNLLLFVDTAVDPALANVTINEGILGLQGLTTGLGNPSNTVITVNGAGAGQTGPAGSSGSILQFNNLINPLNKNVLLKNSGIFMHWEMAALPTTPSLDT